MASNQSLPPILFKVGDRVRITYVPGAVMNISEGITGTVISVPQIVARMVQVEVKLDDGREIWWPQENLECLDRRFPPIEKSIQPEVEEIEEYFPETPKRLKPEPVTIDITASRPENEFIPSICIDPEFKSLIPPLSDEERSQLEANLLREGCRDRLVIWKGHNILLDGHNRHSICTQHGIGFDVIELELPDREAAINWIIDLQLGRRNLLPEQASYLRGRKYHLLKAQIKNPDGRKGKKESKLIRYQNDTKQKTAEVLAKEYKVGSATINRDADFARNLDEIASAAGNETKQKILARQLRINKQDIKKLAKIAKSNPEALKQAFNSCQRGAQIIERALSKKAPERNELFPYQVGDFCRISAPKSESIRAFNGFWGIVVKIYEGRNYCDFLFWKGVELQMHITNLKPCSIDDSNCQNATNLVKRMARIMKREPEAVVVAVIQDISRRNPGAPTELEEEILSLFERKYRIEQRN